MAAAAGFVLSLVTPALILSALMSPAKAQIVIGGDGGSSVTVNMDVIDGRTGGRLTTPGSDGRILLMPNAPRESQERIVLRPPASMRGAQPAKPAAMAAAPQLTPPAAMRPIAPPMSPSAATPSSAAPSAPAVRAPTVLQPEKPAAPKVAAPQVERPQIAAPKPAETPKPAAPAASTEKPATATQRTAALPSAKPEPVKPPASSTPPASATPKAEPKPAEQKVAALPPKDSAPSQPAPAGVTRLSFGFNQAEMDEAARAQLQGVTKRLQDNDSLRVQLLAYAGGEGVSSSQARRLSLSRALAVRSHLIEQGIRSTRMDVRALGDTGKDGPDDRVDIRIIDR